DFETLAHALGEIGVIDPARFVRKRQERPADRLRWAGRSEDHVFLAFRPGNGKQKMKKGSQRKMKSKSITMMMRRTSAQMVTMGIESEQIMPRLRSFPVLHGAPSPASDGRSL